MPCGLAARATQTPPSLYLTQPPPSLPPLSLPAVATPADTPSPHKKAPAQQQWLLGLCVLLLHGPATLHLLTGSAAATAQPD